MEFDKSKVYSAVNADELHEGDKVIVAYSLSYLKHCVECDECMDEIVSILSDDNQNRFLISGSRTFALAYLVERAETPELTSLGNGQYIERKHYRPFYNTDELIEEWDKKLGYRDPTGLAKPYIWVRSKFNKDHKGCLITNFFGKYIMMNNQQCFLSRLFDEYTFLDGSPCGVEV